MRKLCLLWVALCTTCVSFSQDIKDIEVVMNPKLVEEHELPYSSKPISWQEFKGKPDNNCGFIAMTYSGFRVSHRYTVQGGVATARVEVFPYMDLRRSWYKKGHCNDSTLAHEQRHFDITALVTRMFAAELKKRSFSVARFSSQINKLHQEYIDKIAEMQEAYDRETAHGTKPDHQAAWDKRIAEELRQALDEG